MQETHICNDRVTVVLGHKVLDLAGGGIRQPVASNEVVCDVVLLGIRGAAIGNRHRPAVAVRGAVRC